MEYMQGVCEWRGHIGLNVVSTTSVVVSCRSTPKVVISDWGSGG